MDTDEGREIMNEIEEHFENISIEQFEINLAKARGEESGSMEIIRNDHGEKVRIKDLDIGNVFVRQGEEFLALEFDEDRDLKVSNLRSNRKTLIHRDVKALK